MKESKSFATIVSGEVEKMKEEGIVIRVDGKITLSEPSRGAGITRHR